MIDPRTVYVCIPCYKQPEPEVMGSIVSCHGLYHGLAVPSECSHVGLARNLSIDGFLRTTYEWFVGIDNDTGFNRVDFELLMEPCDESAVYAEDILEGRRTASVSDVALWGRDAPPRPSRVLISQSESLRHLDSKTVAAADAIVQCEYAYKNDSYETVKLGMGFVRIHRSVFETLAELKHDGGPTVEVQRHCMERLKDLAQPGAPFDIPKLIEAAQQLIQTAQDKAGEPRLWQTSWQGRHFYDFFPSGPILSQFVPTAEWKGEDHGFFTLCMLAGLIPRVETRTRLLHIGRKAYPYLGPQQGGGQ